jgi:hypothetical protein
MSEATIHQLKVVSDDDDDGKVTAIHIKTSPKYN